MFNALHWLCWECLLFTGAAREDTELFVVAIIRICLLQGLWNLDLLEFFVSRCTPLLCVHSFTWIKKTTNLTTYKLTNKDDMNYKTSSKVFVFSWHQYCLKCVKAETSLLHSENLRRWHLWISHAGLSSRGHTARRMRLFEISDMHTYTSVWRHCIIYRFTLLFTATIKREAGREQVGDRRMDESARS